MFEFSLNLSYRQSLSATFLTFKSGSLFLESGWSLISRKQQLRSHASRQVCCEGERGGGVKRPGSITEALCYDQYEDVHDDEDINNIPLFMFQLFVYFWGLFCGGSSKSKRKSRRKTEGELDTGANLGKCLKMKQSRRCEWWVLSNTYDHVLGLLCIFITLRSSAVWRLDAAAGRSCFSSRQGFCFHKEIFHIHIFHVFYEPFAWRWYSLVNYVGKYRCRITLAMFEDMQN